MEVNQIPEALDDEEINEEIDEEITDHNDSDSVSQGDVPSEIADHSDSSSDSQGDLTDASPPKPTSADEAAQNALTTMASMATKIRNLAKTLSTPSKAPVPPKVTKPKMGNIVEIDGKRMIRMGGIPKVDWSGLDKPTVQRFIQTNFTVWTGPKATKLTRT